MAFAGDVQVVPERGIRVEYPVAVEACDGGSGSSVTTTKEAEIVMTVSLPDHHEDAAAPELTADVSASDEMRPEVEKPPVAMDEGEHYKAPHQDGHQESTRERLKRHRMEVAGSVWVPEKWGQEKLLKDWVDCAVFDRPLVPAGLLKARRALVAESFTRRPERTSTVSSSPASPAGSSPPLPVQNGCSTRSH